MPRLMEKKDWMQTVADVGSADGVWYENVSVDGGHFQLSAPGSGIYRVILVKVGNGPSADYTTWHQRHFDNGESVRELGEKIKKFIAAKRQPVMA